MCGLSRPESSVWMWKTRPPYFTLLLKPTWGTNEVPAGRSASRVWRSLGRPLGDPRLIEGGVVCRDPFHALERELRELRARVQTERLGKGAPVLPSLSFAPFAIQAQSADPLHRAVPPDNTARLWRPEVRGHVYSRIIECARAVNKRIFLVLALVSCNWRVSDRSTRTVLVTRSGTRRDGGARCSPVRTFAEAAADAHRNRYRRCSRRCRPK